MRNTFIPLLALTLILSPWSVQAASAQEPIRNAGFEKGPLGDVPLDWVAGGSGPKTLEVVAEGVHEGDRAVRLSREAGGALDEFGSLSQTVDAAQYRGKRVRYRAWVRTDSTPDAIAGLWLRVDRPDQQTGFMDNMRDRPITGETWEAYEIVADVAEDATSIVFGVLLQGGGGAVWLDTTSLEVVASDPG